MATLVKFLKDIDGDVYAYFPQLNERRNSVAYKTCYAHVGQHSACHVDYMKECKLATALEYADLLAELKQVGYEDLRVLNKPATLPADQVAALVSKMDVIRELNDHINKIDRIVMDMDKTTRELLDSHIEAAHKAYKAIFINSKLLREIVKCNGAY